MVRTFRDEAAEGEARSSGGGLRGRCDEDVVHRTVAHCATVFVGSARVLIGSSRAAASAGGLATDFTLVPISQVVDATQAFRAAGFHVANGLGRRHDG